MTEGNETVTLHTETLNRIVTMLREKARKTGNPTPESMANTIEAQRSGGTTKHVAAGGQFAVGFCGLPGAGKSKAAEIFAEQTDGEAISMGDAIRHEAQKKHPDMDGFTSEWLADFAAEARSEDASQIPEWVTDLASESQSDIIAIDGVRSITDYKVLSRFFEAFILVRVTAPFYERLQRVKERGREGEDEFGPEDLLERDEHEYEELGFRELIEGSGWEEDYLPDEEFMVYDTGYVDINLDNSHNLWRLENAINIILDSYPWCPEPPDEPVYEQPAA